MFHAPVKAARILVADGDDLVTQLLTFRLENLGYVVEAATSTHELMERIAEAEYDAIILDDLLPQAGGVEPLQWINLQDKSGGVPVLVLASRRSETDVVRLLQMGADECFPKPINIDELALRLGRALTRSRVRLPAAAGRALRASVSMPTRLKLEDGSEIACRVRDISRTGFMAEVASPLKPGEPIRILLPKLGPVAAEVRWSRAGQLGAQFAEELDLTVLRREGATRETDLLARAAP
jgi:DNA-binding response OmpR family regulator